MAVRFQLPKTTNYSTKFLSCKRASSPYPICEHYQKGKSTTFKPKHGFSMEAYLKIVKKVFKHHAHKSKTDFNTSNSTTTDEMEEKWQAARRNASDFGSRPRCNGTPVCLFTYSPATLDEIKRKNAHMQELDERAYWADDEKDICRAACTHVSPRREDGAQDEPVHEDVRSLGHILAWMHSQGINAAGFPTTDREKRACLEGRCRCLGPMMRDV
ncbi:uncharacterized protein M421DRAFT_389466 [Didymella exigua CBS 183.55]|uniref:Uncharacterized protein n=1 Tax=Didymella exigua CBS 183.55 TaxID=1150837 RepID=A0A6A5RPM3_9PLEO|nr:uncharacterized protein M421DRAFT_389466 [Didymella exigua CBS 183.55]KAF1929722.1 hypothetical protein M421DRAFT_389466 [Didymella exigua CBS 183.55]